VVPIWFHWDSMEFVLGTPPKAPKLKALAPNPKVALTIDDNNFPHKVLLVRGTVRLETVQGMCPSTQPQRSATSGANRDRLGSANFAVITPSMVRVAITPEWVGILDFQTRFPSALST
jgi:Pyridoxamine 5'-phosphate oxidase